MKHRALGALALAVALLAETPAPSVPDTLAGQALTGWLQAFDSGNRTTYQEFLRTKYPSILKDVDDEMQFRQMTGGFDVRRIVTSEPNKIVAILEDRDNEQFGELTLTAQPGDPYVIANLDVRAIRTPAEFAPPPMTQAELIAALRDRVAAQNAAGRFAGAVLVAKNGTPVFEEAIGLADRARNIPNTVQTRFRIGSMNKMFTAVAVMQLVQAGRVKLDAPLGTYLKDYPNKELASHVTIAELLDHTGGTGDIFGPQFEAHRLQLQTLADYERLYGSRALLFKPGSKWDYSNYGFVLLGLVIERVSRQSYYDYVRTHVYVPAGMTSTGSEPEDRAVPNRSIGYTWTPDGTLEPNTDTLPYRASSAGGGYSTVGDLLAFANALQSHRLLNAHYTELLTTGKVDTPNGGRYAYGFEDQTVNGVRCIGHNGGAPGQNGELRICPAIGYVVATLANMDPPAASGIENFAVIRLPK